ncbi:MAG: hypothetical protein ABFC88_14465 [Thermoguttaceae bacterium]
MKRPWICQVVVVFLVASCWSTDSHAGQRYVDDFAQSPSVWRFGNAVTPVDEDGLVLKAKRAGRPVETTLPETVVNPDNLKTFAASLRWRFSDEGDPTLRIGWGKPWEWSRFDQCPVFLQIGRDGRAFLYVGSKTLGAWQLPAVEKGEYALTFAQEPGRVVLRSGSRETSFSMPAEFECRPGYVTLQLRGDRGASASIRRFEMDASGNQPPRTEAERRDDIQRWARSQMRDDAKMLEQLKAYLQVETAAGRWGYNTALDVAPGLVRVGEKVTATLRVVGPIPSPCEATVQWNYLRKIPGPVKKLQLDWKPDARGGQTAVVDVSPTQPGNGRIVWRVGEERISRMFAALDDGYAVCRLLLTSYAGLRKPDRTGEVYDVIHQHGLAADFWDGSEHTAAYVRTPSQLAENYRVFATMRHRYGDHILPMCHANSMISRCPDSNLVRLDAELQRDGIHRLMELWDLLGIGPMELLGSYTYSHDTPHIARQLGIKAIDSLVPWQNWRDGGDDNAWLINQLGAPNVPYYVAEDDYRKVAPGRSIVALPQGTTSNVRLYFINTLEGQPQLASLRWHSQKGQMGETWNCDRFQATVDLWLAESQHQREPMFLFIGLENFRDLADWDQANTLGVNYLREQAKDKKLVFASGADIADYFTRHYAKQPENWFYWPDIYCGYQVAYKPRRLPDRIELNNADFHSVHEWGSTLPRFFWDFTRPWSEPLWDNQAAIRKQFGLCDPDLLTADNCVPRMVNLDGVRATANVKPTTGGVQVRIEIESSKPFESLPIAVWNIPLQAAGLNVAKTSESTRFVPIVDGSTENLHGLVVCKDISPGKTTRFVEIRGASRGPVDPTLRIGDHVAGRMFLRNGVPYVYLWLVARDSTRGTLKIDTPKGRNITVHYNNGKTQAARNGTLIVKFDQSWSTESPLVMGMTSAELARSAKFECD